MKTKLKNGTKVKINAVVKGYTEDGLVILSIGSVDNYILTFDEFDVLTHEQHEKAF